MSSSGKTATRVKQEPGLKSIPASVAAAAVKIKQEPGTVQKTDRLTSFRVPRDLTLGGIPTVRSSRGAANKKVYTPNLNAIRNKNALVQSTDDDREGFLNLCFV